VLGLFASTAGMARLPSGLRETLERAALEAAVEQRAMGPQEDSAATSDLVERGMTIRPIDGSRFREPAERLWHAEARALDVASWLEAIRG
jgi:TRAP-type C4-dicarboxylate transport system substrate-binding protein